MMLLVVRQCAVYSLVFGVCVPGGTVRRCNEEGGRRGIHSFLSVTFIDIINCNWGCHRRSCIAVIPTSGMSMHSFSLVNVSLVSL